jgi:hypothetical protein
MADKLGGAIASKTFEGLSSVPKNEFPSLVCLGGYSEYK